MVSCSAATTAETDPAIPLAPMTNAIDADASPAASATADNPRTNPIAPASLETPAIDEAKEICAVSAASSDDAAAVVASSWIDWSTSGTCWISCAYPFRRTG